MNNLRNSVQLIGNLGSNPELKVLEGGKKLATVSIATKDVYHSAKGEKVVETTWHKVVAWGKLAENMEVLLRKGNEVVLRGKLQHKSYVDKDGIKRYTSEVVANEFLLLTKTEARGE